jgi:hypothetical protein
MKKAATSLLLILFFKIGFCQEKPTISLNEFGVKSSLKSFFKEEKTIWTSPVKLNKNSFNYILPAIASIGIAYTFDKPINRELTYLNNHNTFASDANKNITYLGDGAVNVGISSLFMLNGVIFKNHQSFEAGYLSTKAIVHAGVVVYVLKTIAGRERPYYDNHQGNFHFFNKLDAGSAYHSFPSGHTITAFSMATVIAKTYSDKKWVGATAYGLATMVGLSRIGLNKHWSSDVLTGAILGYAIGNMTFKIHHHQWHFTIN